MRADLAKILQDKFNNQPVEFYDPSIFEDLQIGDNYIALPTPGIIQDMGVLKLVLMFLKKLKK